MNSNSPMRRALLIKSALNGKSVNRTCRDANISRTTFYRWIKQYNRQHGIDSPVLVRAGTKSCPRTITACIKRKVVNCAVKHSTYTIRQIAADTGVSIKSVWKILHTKELISKEQRESYLESHSIRSFPVTSFDTKVNLLMWFEQGEKINRICNETGISKSIFYRWLRYYRQAGNDWQVLKSPRPSGDRHYRFNKAMEESVLSVVGSHPEYSLNQILTSINGADGNSVSRSGVYKVLKRFLLTTPEQRYAYAQAANEINSKPVSAAKEQLPAIPHYSFISYLSPPSRDLVLLMHILFFEILHQNLEPAINCAICSFVTPAENSRAVVEDEGKGGSP